MGLEVFVYLSSGDTSHRGSSSAATAFFSVASAQGEKKALMARQ